MLDYKLINYKPTITKDNETYIDLLSKTYDEGMVGSFSPIVVNKYYVARPDLISLAVYGDDKYGDIICKVNGISNPFELNEDMLILLPNVEFLSSCVLKNQKKSDLIEDPKTDRIYKNNETNLQKKKNELRSPNQQVIGDSNYIIDKSLGIVFY